MEKAAPAPATPTASRVETANVVLPGLTNVHGNIFGGILLQWIDLAAAIAAGRHAGLPVVTAALDRVHFLRPVKLGALVIVQAQVNFVAHTSMEVGVRVFVEELRTKERIQATRAYVTMVAIDEAGRPAPVQPLVLETDDDRRRHAAAEQRRAGRLSERRSIESRHP
jgi:acyl-CoA hydrolase